jgi:hypothetical protein
MNNAYDTKTNRAVLNYLSKMREKQNSSQKYVQQFIQPDTLRVINPLFGTLRGDQGESNVRKSPIQMGGNKKVSLGRKIQKKGNAPQYIKLDIQELNLPKKEKKEPLIENKKSQSNILNKLL